MSIGLLSIRGCCSIGSVVVEKYKFFTVVGEVLLTFGVIVLLFVFWDVSWTNIQSGRKQTHALSDLDNKWSDSMNTSDDTLESGMAFAKLHIPSFGTDFTFAIVQGVGVKDLEKGPGHYTSTQNPGEKGNFALAGHRVGRGAPFNDLGLLHTCDSIVIETKKQWNIYRVLPIGDGQAGQAEHHEREKMLSQCLPADVVRKMSTGPYAKVQGRYITTPHNVSVIHPVPGLRRSKPGSQDAGLLTLTTCHPQFSNAERMIVHAVLVRSEKKESHKIPEELRAGE